MLKEQQQNDIMIFWNFSTKTILKDIRIHNDS